MKFSNIAAALLLITAFLTVTNLLHASQHAAQAGDTSAAMRAGNEDAALRAELAYLAAAAKAGDALAREPSPPPNPPPAAGVGAVVGRGVGAGVGPGVGAAVGSAVKSAPPPPKPASRSDLAHMTVVVVKPDLYDHGHTFGEFKIFAAILWGAQKLGAATVVVTTRAEAAQVHGSNVIVVSDQYTEAALKKSVNAARRYNVDFWGTPREQAEKGTMPAQYLVPYPYACGNTFLGFRVEDAAFRAAPPQKEAGLVVVLGKEPKYFTPAVRRALEEIARLPGVARVVATVPKSKAGGLPACVENRGLLDAGSYAQLLGAAQVALGLGDPVLGPGALDALEHGCAVVQIAYSKPRVERWVNPRLPWRTQHDFADRVGPPWVASVALAAYAPTVEQTLAAVAGEPPRSRLPEAYSDAALLGRVEAWLREPP